MYMSGYLNYVHHWQKQQEKYKIPYESNVISAEGGEICSNAGRWPIDAVISNRIPMAAPRKLILGVWDQCGFACDMCTYHPGKLETKMTLKDWKKLVYETHPAGVVYTLFGGEPLLYPEIDELVAYMGKLGVQMNLVTNGYHLQEHLDVLLENHCHVVLSIDGVGETHDLIRGREGSFERIENSLSRMFGKNMDKWRGFVSVNSVLLPENAFHVRKLIDYLYGIGVANISFQHLQFFGEREQKATDGIWRDYLGQPFRCLMQPRKNYVFDRETIDALQAGVEEIRKARVCYPDMGIYIFPDLSAEELKLYYGDRHYELRDKSLCLNPWGSAAVTADGNINLCLDACIGNCREQNFWSAWYGKRAVELRDMVTNHIFPVCTRCCNFYNSYLPE